MSPNPRVDSSSLGLLMSFILKRFRCEQRAADAHDGARQGGGCQPATSFSWKTVRCDLSDSECSLRCPCQRAAPHQSELADPSHSLTPRCPLEPGPYFFESALGRPRCRGRRGWGGRFVGSRGLPGIPTMRSRRAPSPSRSRRRTVFPDSSRTPAITLPGSSAEFAPLRASARNTVRTPPSRGELNGSREAVATRVAESRKSPCVSNSTVAPDRQRRAHATLVVRPARPPMPSPEEWETGTVGVRSMTARTVCVGITSTCALDRAPPRTSPARAPSLVTTAPPPRPWPAKAAWNGDFEHGTLFGWGESRCSEDRSAVERGRPTVVQRHLPPACSLRPLRTEAAPERSRSGTARSNPRRRWGRRFPLAR